MNLLRYAMLATILCFSVLSQSVHAIELPNPSPTEYGNDDGSTVFTPSNPITSVRGFDLFGLSDFGFFFTSNPGNLIPIFTNDDVGVNQLALIDFTNGAVIDFDQTLANNGVPAIRSVFAPQPGSIGFYVLNPNIPFPLSTLPSMNPAGLDLAVSFPSLTVPDFYLLGFGVPEDDSFLPLSYNVAIGLSAVPEPSSMLLLGIGVCGVAYVRRRKK